MSTSTKTRPTKKQYETLQFIAEFIKEHGYSPSYREIMKGCQYTSVATVALHVSNLMKRGHLVKRDKSARSLEVVGEVEAAVGKAVDHIEKLVSEIEQRFARLEKEASEELLNEVYVLVGALKVLGHHDMAVDFAKRIAVVSS